MPMNCTHYIDVFKLKCLRLYLKDSFVFLNALTANFNADYIFILYLVFIDKMKQ